MLGVFIDTNVLVYAKDPRNPTKMKRAADWVAASAAKGALVLSSQSLREFYSVTTRKVRLGGIETARADTIAYSAFVPENLRLDRLAEAWALQDRYRLGLFDALLIAAALAARCEVFLSEDLQPGLEIGQMRVIDPFQSAPQDVFGA